MSAAAAVEMVEDGERAAALLDPLRLEILRQAREPRSASEIADRLRLPRQRVNYHVRRLASAHFLRKAGRRRKRNLYEQRYVASARSYLLSPEVLGPLAEASPAAAGDRFSAGYLLALSARLQRELGRAAREAVRARRRLAVLGLDAELRFQSAEERRRFADALLAAVTRVVAEHASPYARADGSPGPGRPYRLVLGCHPIPAGGDPAQEAP
jgi:DNA-binding transcriptional ArsR family regulator